MMSQRRAVHGNRKKCGTVLSDVAIFLLSSVIFVALRCEVAGAQKCEAIFEGGDFSVTRAVLDEVKDDFQKLLDCVPKRGKLSIEPELNIKPTSTVVVKNAIEVTSSGKGGKRPVFNCPDVGQPLFEISSTGVELKNLVVSDCMTDSNVTSAIVVDIEKDKNSKTTSLEITGVDFVNNTNLNGTASIFIKSAGSLSLAKVVFSRNAGLETGGLYLHSAGMEVNVKDCVFEENRAKFFGERTEGQGAVLFQDVPAFITVTGSRFLNNFAEKEGGAMYIKGEPPASGLTITDTEFHNNTAAQGSGGVLWASGPTFELTVKNCTFTENKARAFGGTIHLRTSRRSGEIKVEIEDSVFEKNIALAGGALWALANIQWRMGISISNSKFLRNEALLQHTGPGEIFEQAINQSTTSAGTGGAITCIGVSVDLKFKGNLFEKNTAIGLGGVDQRGSKGGAIAITDLQNVTITDTVFRENSAINLGTLGHEAVGGAIFLAAGGIKAARVSDTPRGSKCELQCDSSSTTILRTTINVVAGCGALDGNGRRICVLANQTECEGVIPEENLVGLGEEELAATCKIIVIESDVGLSDTKFLDNTVDGAGGAIFVTEEGATLRLGKGVDFLRNTAKNSSGGALFLQDGPTLFAEDVILKDNVAGISGGGIALEGSSANLILRGGSFIGNKAKRGNGGVISSLSTESNITITGPRLFRRNQAEEEGGVLACLSEDSTITFTDANFSNNQAAVAGGAIHAKSARGNVTVDLVGVSFSKNRIKPTPDLPLLGKGGAISLEGAAITLSISGEANTFSKNSAREGGAIRLFDTDKADISRASFTENVALSGGGLHASFTRKSDSLAVSLTKVDFIGNKGYMGGGVMADARSANLSFVPDADGLTKAVFLPSTTFSPTAQISFNGVRFKEQQIVKDGGGMFLIDIHAVGENCDFQDNRAAEGFHGGGGAVKLSDSARFDLTSGTFTGNRAVDGGAVFVSNSLFNGRDLEFSKNTAFGNGGLDSDEDSPQKDQVLVKASEAGENCEVGGFGGGGGAVKLVDSARFNLTSGDFNENQAVDGGALFVSNSIFTGKNLELSKNSALNKGGSIATVDSAQGGRSAVTLEESKIDRNVAKLGGGIFSDVVEPKGTKGCPATQAVRRTLDLDSVQEVVMNAGESRKKSPLASTMSLLLKSTVISNNEAKDTGGGIFTANPSLVCACCESKCSTSCALIDLTSDDKLERVCAESWVGNAHGTGYGPMLASFEDRVEVIKLDGRLLEENEVLDDSHSSGKPLVSLKALMKDYFDQVVTLQRPNVFAQVKESESTGNQILFDEVASQVKEGVADFNATVLSAPPGDYQLKMSFPGLKVGDIRFSVRVRECVRGENPVEGDIAFSCRQCESDNFSFRPGQNCTGCPPSTTCGTGTLTPVDGFWHSSSWSEAIHKCLVDVACSYTNRSIILGMESEQSGAEPLHFRDHSLCRTGYEGPLCGSCASGYGRVRAFECQECLSKLKTIFLMTAMVFWMVIIVGFIIRNALKAGTPVKARANSEREGGNLENSPAIYLGVNPATENAKILINFVQVTSIALVINVEWREEVRQVLQIEDLASGFSTNESIISFDCSLAESGVPVSIRRTIMAMLLPFAMMLFPISIALRSYFDKARSRTFNRRALVSFLVVAYVFYTGTTRRALRILHGVSLDSGDSKSVYAFAKGRFWADDTSVGYFEGGHTYLVLFLGLPVLLFYSIGFPTYLFYVLRGNKEKLNDESFARSYGFLYRAYSNKFVYWEIIVMARKALLVGVVVFAYELGGNLQSVLAVAVLMVALILHLNSQPYREELSQMNQRETWSLYVSVFTYLAGIAFGDDRLPVWFEVLLSVLLVGATSALVIYLVCALATESARHLETLLEEREVVVPENATTWLKMRLLVNYYWVRTMDCFWHFTEQGIAWSKAKMSQPTPRV
ncbi:hypothetical protein BSKO_13511 [Bryopsis sp. KO-2023]|nr:hypothetical protein BSKO_13511 [Bryopsis sp. KO-2023]